MIDQLRRCTTHDPGYMHMTNTTTHDLGTEALRSTSGVSAGGSRKSRSTTTAGAKHLILSSHVRPQRRLPVTIAGCLIALVVVLFAGASPARGYYIYHCPGYQYDNTPPPCTPDPYNRPATHEWLAEQAKLILFYDRYTKYASLLQSPIHVGNSGLGQRHIDLVIQGLIQADVGLNGCTRYGRQVGWPVGDHMLNPYRTFGYYSYYRYPDRTGWVGIGYLDSNGRTTGDCAGTPRVKTNSAAMADKFFARAQNAWRAYQPGDAMFNLGVALHVLQDATEPRHVHPEYRLDFTRDTFPAWAAEKEQSFGVTNGGLYSPPSSANGVAINNSPGGWVYWMAALAYPYFRWDAATSAIPSSQARCDVAEYPEECRTDAIRQLQTAQRVSAGFLRYFFGSVGY